MWLLVSRFQQSFKVLPVIIQRALTSDIDASFDAVNRALLSSLWLRFSTLARQLQVIAKPQNVLPMKTTGFELSSLITGMAAFLDVVRAHKLSAVNQLHL